MDSDDDFFALLLIALSFVGFFRIAQVWREFHCNLYSLLLIDWSVVSFFWFAQVLEVSFNVFLRFASDWCKLCHLSLWLHKFEESFIVFYTLCFLLILCFVILLYNCTSLHRVSLFFFAVLLFDLSFVSFRYNCTSRVQL